MKKCEVVIMKIGNIYIASLHQNNLLVNELICILISNMQCTVRATHKVVLEKDFYAVQVDFDGKNIMAAV